MRILLVLLAALHLGLLPGPASARQALGEPTSASTLNPDAQAALEAFRAEVSGIRSRHAAEGAAGSVSEELARRVEIDQAARNAYSALMRGDAAARDAMEPIGADIIVIDTENTAYLKSVLPSDGWFRNSRDGEQTTSNAWLIVQHSPDHVFMREVLAAMEPLAKAGEVNGRDYALLYDRVEMFAGRPQRYGSQVVCSAGIRSFHVLEDATVVDRRREEVGHPETFAETGVRLRVGQPCG